MSTLLIDADGLAFRAAAAVQTNIDWGDEVLTSHADLDQAKDAFNHQLDRITDAAEEDIGSVVLCWSCRSRRYFRHDLLPTYKGNRKGNAPLALRPLREWANETFKSYEKENLEADDVLGILATHPKLIPGEKVIVSHDKDLGQIPGLHLNPMKPSEGVYRITPEFGHRLLAYQVLVGDTTDNYTGCPKIGPVKAEKLLQAKGDEPYRDLLWRAYEKAGLTQDDLAIQLNVARILQTHHYDFKTKRPILWQAK
jgi:5'-3' exonuclease